MTERSHGHPLTRHPLTRRSLLNLGLGAVLSASACASSVRDRRASSASARSSVPASRQSSSLSVPPSASAIGTPWPRAAALTAELRSLERSGAHRIGLAAIDTGTGRRFGYRAGERFAMCSTAKVLTVADVVSRIPLTRSVPVRRSDLVDGSPVTERYVGRSLSVWQLCAAAMRYSDNTAINLVQPLVGGPSGVTAFVRAHGDSITRLDRTETSLNSAIPGDPRDTSTPDAMTMTCLRLLTGRVLNASGRSLIIKWMRTNTTGDERIRAAAPADWLVGDKTGTGERGTANDIALLWPPRRAPIALCVFTTGLTAAAQADSSVVAAAARQVLADV